MHDVYVILNDKYTCDIKNKCRETLILEICLKILFFFIGIISTALFHHSSQNCVFSFEPFIFLQDTVIWSS